MKTLLYKQLKLAVQPQTVLFMFFGAMLLIPSYPYSIAFFYVALGIFFMFLNMREQKDILFSMLLPVRKADTVRGAILFSVLVELFSILIAVLFLLLSRVINPNGTNLAAMNANVSLLGIAFLLFALFNLIFFPSFYKNGYKVGTAFIKGSIAMLPVVTLDVVLPHIPGMLPLNEKMPNPAQWMFLAACILLYASMTLCALKRSERLFDKVDL